MRILGLVVAVLLLAAVAGCSSKPSGTEKGTTSATTSRDVGTIQPQPGSGGEPTKNTTGLREISLASGDFDLNPQTPEQATPLMMATNVTYVHLLLKPSTVADSNLHATLTECGGMASGGINVGNGFEQEADLCDEVPAGSHTFTIGVDAGIAQGHWVLTGYVPA